MTNEQFEGFLTEVTQPDPAARVPEPIDNTGHPLLEPTFIAALAIMDKWVPKHACDQVAFTWDLQAAVQAALGVKGG